MTNGADHRRGFFPDARTTMEVQAATEMISNPSTEFEFRKPVKNSPATGRSKSSGRDGHRTKWQTEGYEVKLPSALRVR